MENVANRIKCGLMQLREVIGMLCNKKVLIKVKGKFYKTFMEPAIIYGFECWIINKQEKIKMIVVEMRTVRWMCDM